MYKAIRFLVLTSALELYQIMKNLPDSKRLKKLWIPFGIRWNNCSEKWHSKLSWKTEINGTIK